MHVALFLFGGECTGLLLRRTGLPGQCHLQANHETSGKGLCIFRECLNAWAFLLIFQKVLALQSWAYRVFLLSGVPVAGRGRWNLDRFGAGFADVYKGQLYGLGDGEGGECRMHFQRPLKCTGFASLSKKDRLCKGHMQDMPIPHAFWQPA